MESLKSFKDELRTNASQLCRTGYGILAADESTATIGKRFDGIKIENNVDNRRTYRELLFTTEGLENYISGVILFEETLYQSTSQGKKFVDLLKEKGILTGIKVDVGTVAINDIGETATQGLDKLGARCAQYYKDGARFAKWRAVLHIDPSQGKPTHQACLENAHGLARYARICQENGLVPIVEPEVLVDGKHSIDDCAAASEKAFSYVVRALHNENVYLEGILLKPNMVLPGTESGVAHDQQLIANLTLRTLRRTLPAAVPGVVFLSGGQSEREATVNLNEMNKFEARLRPWNLSFSYGRALQHSVLKAWLGKVENVAEAQKVLLGLAQNNSLATKGEFVDSGASTSEESLHVKNYVY